MVMNATALTILDRETLGALWREPRPAAHEPPLNPSWLALMEDEGWLVVGDRIVVVHPDVATWFEDDGALNPAYAVWQPVTVTLEWDAADEPTAPWVTGYTDGTRWNGSVAPLLPAQAVRVLLTRAGLPYRYEADEDAFVVTTAGTDLEDRFEARSVVIQPGTSPVTLYGVDGWIWVESAP